MAYRRSITSSHHSDDEHIGGNSYVSWPSGASYRYEWVWDSARRARRLPGSSEDEEEDNHVASSDECEHAERIARVARRRAIHIAQLEGRVDNLLQMEQQAEQLNNQLIERVAEITCNHCALGTELEAANGRPGMMNVLVVVLLFVLVIKMWF